MVRLKTEVQRLWSRIHSTDSDRRDSLEHTHTAYCVKCKEVVGFVGTVRTSDSGRQMAQGRCPRCDTRVNRILGKAVTNGKL